MALEASICFKCGSLNSRKCFCGGDRIVFNVTEDQYIKMSETEIQQMIEQMGIKPQISKDDALVIYNATKSVEIIDAMIELKKTDIIEYGVKLSQFKTQLAQQKSTDTPTAKARWVLMYIHFQIYSKAYKTNEFP